MNTAEILPDNINKITTDSDAAPPSDHVEAPRPLNAQAEVESTPQHTDRFHDVIRLIQNGVEESANDEYATLMVRIDGRQKPLAQFMANDIYKLGLTSDEVRDLLRAYMPEATYRIPEPTRRNIGHYATVSTGKRHYFDYRELQAGEHLDSD